MSKYYYLYIIASDSGTLYLGMTNNLERRIWEHKNKIIDGFSKKYNCYKLIYYEYSEDVNAIITREKQIKKWRRDKKEFLIKQFNPTWKDLSIEMFNF